MELTKTPCQDMNLRARDDHSLVQMAVCGNNAAFSILFDRYRSPLFHFISKRTPNSADVPDLALEAFEKAFLKLHYVCSESCFQHLAVQNCPQSLH